MNIKDMQRNYDNREPEYRDQTDEELISELADKFILELETNVATTKEELLAQVESFVKDVKENG